MLNYGMKSFVFGLLISLAPMVWAEDTWIHVNGRSFHKTGDFRGWNPGLGIERSFNQDWSWATGWYMNSINRNSTYGLAKRIWNLDPDWQINLNLGGVTGYRGYTLAPVILPEACYRWICGLYIPRFSDDNVAAAAFYLRIPIQ